MNQTHPKTDDDRCLHQTTCTLRTCLHKNSKNNGRPRPMSTIIDFPLRNRILRQLSTCNTLETGSYSSLGHQSCSSSSSMYSYQSSSEQLTSLSSTNLHEKSEGSLVSRIIKRRSKKLHQPPGVSTSLRRHSLGFNSTQSAALNNSIKNLDISSSTQHSNTPNNSSIHSKHIYRCTSCSKPTSQRFEESQIYNSQTSLTTTLPYLSGPESRVSRQMKNNDLYYDLTRRSSSSKRFQSKQFKKCQLQVVNVVKFKLNKLGSSMPNLYESKSIVTCEPRRPVRRSSINSTGMNYRTQRLSSEKSVSSSCLSPNGATYSSMYCCCSSSTDLMGLTNNSPRAPSIAQLTSTGLRDDLRPRNSSTSSFGSPVPKIEEEIDPIEDFEFNSNPIKSTTRQEHFFPMISNSSRHESSFNSSSSSLSSMALHSGSPLTSLTSTKLEPSKLSIEPSKYTENYSSPKLSANTCSQKLNFFPSDYDRVKENEDRVKSNSLMGFLPNDQRESRGIHRKKELNQLNSSYVSNFEQFADYPIYRRTQSLNNTSPRVLECDLIKLCNERFKLQYPTHWKKMKQDLKKFIALHSDPTCIINCQLYPAARFIHNQITEIAKLCLEKAEKSQLTCSYFEGIIKSLEKLLEEARTKCIEAEKYVEYLKKFVNSLLSILIRAARFLDIFEFQRHEHISNIDIAKNYIYKLNDSLKHQSVEITSSFEKITNLLRKQEMPREKDFEQIKLISNGAYGAVHLIRHRINGERYAMKKIKKRDLILKNQLQQVFTERDIMIFTHSPFVVALLCTFETKSSLCMVMEYVEGGDVATLIQNMGPLSLDVARMYFAEATLAVEYLHNYGIIHRDLKPDNFLITSVGHIKLTDFGLSKVGLMNLTANYEASKTSTEIFNDKQICGTPQYLPPEVILRQGYGKTVDWWSMGIILYEFLTSFTPFNGDTPEELFANVVNGEITWPEEDDLIKIIVEAKDLIQKLLTHDPSERFGAGGAVEIKYHPFFNYLNWDNLIVRKADFIPQLDGPDDTSYFDSRSDRYNHESFEDSNYANESNLSNDQNELFASFSSYASRFQDSLDIVSCNEYLSNNDTSNDEFNSSTVSEVKVFNEIKTPEVTGGLKHSDVTVNMSSALPSEPTHVNAPQSVLIRPSKTEEASSILDSFIENKSDIEEFVIRKSPSGYGFSFLEHKVFSEFNSQKYTIQHLVDTVNPKGLAYKTGLREGHVITHVNDQIVSGLIHSDFVKLLFKRDDSFLIKAIKEEKTSIKTGDKFKYIEKNDTKIRLSHSPGKKTQATISPRIKNYLNNLTKNDEVCSKQKMFGVTGNFNFKYYNSLTHCYESNNQKSPSSMRPLNFTTDKRNPGSPKLASPEFLSTKASCLKKHSDSDQKKKNNADCKSSSSKDIKNKQLSLDAADTQDLSDPSHKTHTNQAPEQTASPASGFGKKFKHIILSHLNGTNAKYK